MVKSLVMGDSGKKMVTVIGGGFAGLAAAAELSSHNGIQVTLVEAANYLGGRVKQERPFKGCQLLDIGGEFVHGEHTTALELAKKFAWDFEELWSSNRSSTTAYGYVGGKLSPLNETNPKLLKKLVVYEQFLECGRKIRRGLNASRYKSEPLALNSSDSSNEDHIHNVAENLRDLSLKQFLDQEGNVDKTCEELVDVVYCQTDGNDLERIGMLESSRSDDCWEYGCKNFRLKDSYAVLLQYYIQKCKTHLVDIKLNWAAKTVSWDFKSPSFVSSRENDNVVSDFIVITVPLQILKDGTIEFIPDILQYKKEALDCMEMRNGCKIFCCFMEKFWQPNLRLVYCETSFPFSQVWTEDSFRKDGKTFHILCGFATASVADKAANTEIEKLKNLFLEQLDLIFGGEEEKQPATRSFVEHFFYDWGSNPLIRGCYSSPVVNSYAKAEQLAKPIENKLFFAGEATNTCGASTVQSAIDSGDRAAKEIINIIDGLE